MLISFRTKRFDVESSIPEGAFYGEDQDNGRPVKVRYTWDKLDRDHAHWEQAFSYDNRTWETNWTADFVRADPAAICEAGRPKRITNAVE